MSSIHSAGIPLDCGAHGGANPTLLVNARHVRICYNRDTATCDVCGIPFFITHGGTISMGENENNNSSNVSNEENDAREEDIVRDVDSDTRDTEEIQERNYDETEKRFAGIEATLDKILGQLSSLREAQGILVENGAVVRDTDSDIGHTEEDEFIPPMEMDLLI